MRRRRAIENESRPHFQGSMIHVRELTKTYADLRGDSSWPCVG